MTHREYSVHHHSLSTKEATTSLSLSHTSSIHQLLVLLWRYSCRCRAPFLYYIIPELQPSWMSNILRSQTPSHSIIMTRFLPPISIISYQTSIFLTIFMQLSSNGSSIILKEPNLLTTTSTCLLPCTTEFCAHLIPSHHKCYPHNPCARKSNQTVVGTISSNKLKDIALDQTSSLLVTSFSGFSTKLQLILYLSGSFTAPSFHLTYMNFLPSNRLPWCKLQIAPFFFIFMLCHVLPLPYHLSHFHFHCRTLYYNYCFIFTLSPLIHSLGNPTLRM